MAESNLDASKRLISKINFPFDDLPSDRNDPLWNTIQTQAGLSLPQLSALKNARCSTGHFNNKNTPNNKQ